jgi:hypothetical protein
MHNYLTLLFPLTPNIQPNRSSVHPMYNTNPKFSISLYLFDHQCYSNHHILFFFRRCIAFVIQNFFLNFFLLFIKPPQSVLVPFMLLKQNATGWRIYWLTVLEAGKSNTVVMTSGEGHLTTSKCCRRTKRVRSRCGQICHLLTTLILTSQAEC